MKCKAEHKKYFCEFFWPGYRHHMYSVLQFMWKEENYKDSLMKMGDEVRSNDT